MSVASIQLGHDNDVGAAFESIYTVPANRRTIVKCVCWHNNAGVTNRVVFEVYNGGVSGYQHVETLAASGSVGESLILLPWIVMNAGDELRVYSANVSAQVIASGAELVI